jgi:uncharacterized membrane protein
MSLVAIRSRLVPVKEGPAARRSTYMRPRALNRLLWTAVALLGVIAVAVVVRRASALLPAFAHGYHPSPPPANPVLAQFARIDDIFASHVVLTMIHIVPGLLFVTLGPLQFNATLRARHLRWHRVSGRVYLVAAYIIGVSALIMSFAIPAIGGLNQAAATTFFSIFFLFALSKALWHVLHREIALHREWMIRTFSIGLAVATIRLIVGIFFATSRISGLTPREFFGIAFWIGFVLHVIVAEAWVRHTAASPIVRAVEDP